MAAETFIIDNDIMIIGEIKNSFNPKPYTHIEELKKLTKGV